MLKPLSFKIYWHDIHCSSAVKSKLFVYLHLTEPICLLQLVYIVSADDAQSVAFVPALNVFVPEPGANEGQPKADDGPNHKEEEKKQSKKNSKSSK